MNNQGELVDLPAALFQLTTLLFLGVAGWAALVALLASWRPTRRIAVALTPRLIRAAIFTTVSGTLVMGPANASELDGLPYPDRGVTAAPDLPDAPTQVTASAPQGDHVVKSGDSLWSIAAGAVPPEAGPADVAAATAAWHEANRSTIGPDPDLIHPGQTLTAPEGEAGR